MTDLDSFASVRWPDHNHRETRAWLEERGWRSCGVGDWAVVFRSPDGTLAARVSAFEPSYEWFVELCERLPDNPYLPRISLVSDLDVEEFFRAIPRDRCRYMLEIPNVSDEDAAEDRAKVAAAFAAYDAANRSQD